jgi:predicted metal-binding membrane protein
MPLEGTVAVAVERQAGARLRLGVPVALLVVTGAGWWWSFRMVDAMPGVMDPSMADMAMGHSLSLLAFSVAWVAMMAAMMFPAISPVVRLYGFAAAKGRVAPLPFFVAAYLTVWGAMAVPSYVAWQRLEAPIADGASWAGRLAGGVLLTAAVWQLSPLKSVCLRHCRSPLSFFMQYGSGAARRFGAFRMGVAHGLFCLGCCWALMAVLVALGTMNLAWMAVLTGLIFLEKTAPSGERIAVVGAAALACTGVVLLLRPALITTLT